MQARTDDIFRWGWRGDVKLWEKRYWLLKAEMRGVLLPLGAAGIKKINVNL